MVWKTRGDWTARGPSGGYSWLPDSVGVAYHWEGPPMGAYQQASVPALLRSIQGYHMDTQGWTDVAYSFVFDRYGDIWPARGWNARTAANGTNAGNSGYLAFCYLGGDGDDFTPAARRAAQELFAAHVTRGGQPVATCHHDHTSTACPGGGIHQWIVAGGPAGGTFAPAEEAPDMTPEQEAALARIDRAIGNPGAISGKDRTAYEALLRFTTEAEGRINTFIAGGQAKVAQLDSGLGMCAAAIGALNSRLEGLQMNGGGVGGQAVALTGADLELIATRVADLIAQRMAS